ncbi:MAG TPA: hypothetical protein VEK39_05650 [Solirubrobacterales bacterium]|nr:hypothetical protein [Solirubrobacterales bacterium]
MKLDRGVDAELVANRHSQLTAGRLAGRHHHATVGLAHRDPPLSAQTLGVAPADEPCVDGGREQVDEGHSPLPAESALQVEPVDHSGRQQDPAQPLACPALALQRPVEGLLVDQPFVDEGGADRRDGANQLGIARDARDVVRRERLRNGR